MASEKQTRREWLGAVPAAAAVASASAQTSGGVSRPNIVLVISDQFRWDCIGATGLNPMNLTPNLDQMAARGVLFRQAISNQPVCAPARASIFTGQYPSKHGVWKNAFGLAENATTLASAMKQAGYSTNYIGKWHLARPEGGTAAETRGAVKAGHRGGFADLWEAANALELTSHAYEGDLFDNDNKPIHFANRYRADFMTDRAQLFLRSQAAKSPFLLTLSYLEVHHQNDKDTFDPPKEFAGRYPNPFIPPDLRPLPGSWPSQIADYFACVAKMDEVVGTLRQTLVETGMDKNTIFMFTSDHGNHFRTRNAEYKRSPHESSIHIPLIIEGPGFNRGIQVSELVSQVDFAPTLSGRRRPPCALHHAGAQSAAAARPPHRGLAQRGLLRNVGVHYRPRPAHAAVHLCRRRAQSPRMAGRPVGGEVRGVHALRSECRPVPASQSRRPGPYQKIATELRQRLLARMREASGENAIIDPAWFPYS